jgi:hypothetical protein
MFVFVEGTPSTCSLCMRCHPPLSQCFSMFLVGSHVREMTEAVSTRLVVVSC